ncbi:unnamed protein product [Ectocarpus sp. 6 AP-2014]
MAEPGSQQDGVVAAAREHAARIRRTLQLQQYKREHGRVPPTPGATSKPQTGRGRKRSNFCPPLLDGPIYSTEYWRAWKLRSRAATLRGSRERNTRTCDLGNRTANPLRANGTNRRETRIGRVRLPSSAYSTPTSSFAGGRCGTQIFAAVSGGGGGGDLLKAYHDAVVQPLGKAETRPRARSSSSSNGVRLSYNNPRPKDVGSSKHSAGDGMYDIALADEVVMRTAPSCSFGAGMASGAESAVPGASRDTPGAIYDPNIGGSSAPAPTTLFSPASRFPVGQKVFDTPGPGQYYNPAGAGASACQPAGPGVVAWTGIDTFADSEWSRPVPPPRLRPWQGFGNGCSVQEHIDYGACLDGRCCSRHSVEKKNALLVVQFLDGQRQRRSPRSLESAREDASPPSNSPATHNEDGTPLSFSSADVGGGGGEFAVGSGAARAAVRKRTPLHFASERGELSLVDRLCFQGDDRNAVDERGFTPLHDAAEHGNTRVVSRLLQGDENEVRPAGGENAPRGAAPKRPRQVPADPNVQDDKGRTPLYLACHRGHERAVRALLKAGACPDLVDIRGKPAQEVAGAQKIYQLLQFKADVSLVKANIAALEGRQRNDERQREKVAQAAALKELAELKAEELRLKAAVSALENKREAYAAAAKAQ